MLLPKKLRLASQVPTAHQPQSPAARQASGDISDSIRKLLDKVGNLIGIGKSSSSAASAPRIRKPWPELDADLVLERIRMLKANANLFYQGGFDLCIGAAFFHVIIQTNPNEFENFATALVGAGIGFLGNLKVRPRRDLRDADYAEIVSRLGKKLVPPQADWMLMCSIRDSENWLLDFKGDFTEELAMETTFREMRNWFKKTGWYETITYESDATVEGLRNISDALPQTGTFVLLDITMDLLSAEYEEFKGDFDEHGHTITLNSKIEVDEANNKAEFEYWTWGKEPKILHTTLTSLKQNVKQWLVLKQR